EAHRRVHRPDALSFERRHDFPGDLVDVIAGVVELEVGNRAGRAADRLPVHPANEAEKRLGVWEVAQDVDPLAIQGRAADLDWAAVIGSKGEAQLTEARRIEWFRRLRLVRAGPLSETPDARMFF